MSSVIQVVEPSGILDGTKVTLFRDQITKLVDEGARIILIDLKNVTFVDSSGLGALVSALKMVRSVQGRLCICSINAQVKMLFELTSMDRVFECFPDRDTFHQQTHSSS